MVAPTAGGFVANLDNQIPTGVPVAKERRQHLESCWWTDLPSFHPVVAFSFRINSEIHQVAVGHTECTFKIASDDRVLKAMEHKKSFMTTEHCTFPFDVASDDGTKALPATVTMSWSMLRSKWAYELKVGEKLVPVSWTVTSGHSLVDPPECFAKTMF
mmetsp:Transcript_62265/g.148605  ORF Transcript_62265/g.148605 Transcript_62265/m.148605 type:complete len:158 (-) Transcript_62265:25-498(-)